MVDKPEFEGWHRADIMAAVRKSGSNLAELARDVGLKRQTMYWAFIRPHARANRAIAEFLGVPLHILWPQWFDEDGKLVSTRAIPRPAAKPTTLRAYASRPRKRAA